MCGVHTVCGVFTVYCVGCGVHCVYCIQVDLLRHLTDEELTTLSGCLKEAQYAIPYSLSRGDTWSPPPHLPLVTRGRYASGETIICEGDEGHTFYIIRDGEVKCTKVGYDEEVSRRLVEGDFFGELALLRDDRRAATVAAVQTTNVLTVNRAEITRLLGKLDAPKYD